MISGLLMLLSVCSAAPDVSEAGTRFSPLEFQAWFDHASEGRSPFSATVTRSASKYRYVFVGGFLSERIPGYFAANVKELRAAGVSPGAISRILPSSHESIEGNASEVRSRFERIAALGPEKLVVIAHSRGACDTLAFALMNPEFVRDHVHAMFLLQGPFGGTLLADYVAGEGSPLDGAMPWRDRAIMNVLGKVEWYLQNRGKHSGLNELTRQGSRRFWAKLLRENHDAIAIAGPKTYYVTAATHPSSLRFLQRATGTYLHMEDGPNDGVVALADQSLVELGTVLANVIAGHHDLTASRTSNTYTRSYPRALTDAILMSLAQGEVQVEPAQSEESRRIPNRRRARASASER